MYQCRMGEDFIEPVLPTCNLYMYTTRDHFGGVTRYSRLKI